MYRYRDSQLKVIKKYSNIHSSNENYATMTGAHFYLQFFLVRQSKRLNTVLDVIITIFFQNILSNNTGSKKVILYTYMRGGSTFLGSLFDKNPESVYWYEGLRGFYQRYYNLKEEGHGNKESNFSVRFVC